MIFLLNLGGREGNNIARSMAQPLGGGFDENQDQGQKIYRALPFIF
jgi:hypothetical protein